MTVLPGWPSSVVESQAEIDRRNAAFWNELCGTVLAKQHGITEPSAESLARFDAAYLEMYPYLDRYLPDRGDQGKRVLEIGLGYGTVSQVLAQRGFDYHGLDIAAGPIEMARFRLERLGVDDPGGRVRVGSVLEMDHPDESFDHVVTIGCLHHTGDVPRAVGEVRRVLKPGGRALVMLYNRHSFRLMRMALGRRLRGRKADGEAMRGAYDSNLEGEAAPATEYTSRAEARRLFGGFSEVSVRSENFDPLALPGLTIDRDRLLGWPARLAGLDLYITAVR